MTREKMSTTPVEVPPSPPPSKQNQNTNGNKSRPTSRSGRKGLSWIALTSLMGVVALSLFTIGVLDSMTKHVQQAMIQLSDTSTTSSQIKFTPRQRHEPAKFISKRDVGYQRFIIVPEYKFLFCFIEKTGCMMFSELLRVLRLLHPSMKLAYNRKEAEFQAETTWNRNTPRHHGLNRTDLLRLVNDEEWTKAIFFRDPVSRFVSGMKSKCGRADPDGVKHCDLAFGEGVIKDASVPSFQRALDILDRNTEQVWKNEHWMPMTEFCGGLPTTIHKYDFVNQLNPRTAPDLVRNILLHIGVNANLTNQLINNIVKKGGTARWWQKQQVQKALGISMGFHSMQNQNHNTGTSISMREYFGGSMERLQRLQGHYREDYELFDIPRLDFNGTPIEIR